MSRKIKDICCNLGLAMVAIAIYEVSSRLVLEVGCELYSEEAFFVHYTMIDTFLVTALFFVYCPWVYRIFQNRQATDEISAKRFDKRMLVRLPIIVFGLQGITGLWFLAVKLGLNALPIFAESAQSHEETWMYVAEQPFIWQLLSVALIGPIVEELLFRGIVFHYMEKIKAGWFPILVSGIAFGVWQGEPVQCVYAAIIGVAYGIVYANVRDLRVMFVLHILNNTLTTLLPVVEIDAFQYIYTILSFGMVIPTVVVLKRISRENQHKEEVKR